MLKPYKSWDFLGYTTYQMVQDHSWAAGSRGFFILAPAGA
jgi:hypothetical protein